MVCPPDFPVGSGHSLCPSCQGSCLLMDSQCRPALELPQAEGILNSAPQRQPSSNARVQRLGLLFLCFILRPLWRALPTPELPPWGICWALLQPQWTSHSIQSCVLMASLIRLIALSASQRFLLQIPRPPVTQPKKGTTIKYKNKFCPWYRLHTW